MRKCFYPNFSLPTRPRLRCGCCGQSLLNLLTSGGSWVEMLRHLDPTKIERYSEIHVLNFLLTVTKSTNGGSHYGNVNGKHDLMLLLGETADTLVAVVLEVKCPKNPGEMLVTNDLNCKAFQQLLLYYLEDRSDEKADTRADEAAVDTLVAALYGVALPGVE